MIRACSESGLRNLSACLSSVLAIASFLRTQVILGDIQAKTDDQVPGLGIVHETCTYSMLYPWIKTTRTLLLNLDEFGWVLVCLNSFFTNPPRVFLGLSRYQELALKVDHFEL